MKQEYDRQIEVSEQILQSYEHELELLKNNKGSRQEWINEFKKYENITVLDRSVVTALIKQVRVFEDKKIEVVFNFEEETDRYGILAVSGKSEYAVGCGEGMVV